MTDALIGFFANNVVLSLIIVGVVLFALVPGRGGGGGVLGKWLIRLILLAIVFLVVIPSCVRALDEGWESWKADTARDAPGFVQWGLCRIFRMEAACTVLQMAQAPDAETERRMQCLERVLEQDANDGGREVKTACGLREDAEVWEECVRTRAGRYEKLDADLTTQCGEFRTPWLLMRDLIEPIACPLGIKTWCQTSTEPAPYVYDGPYLQCLSDVVASHGANGSACSSIQDPQQWDACMVDVIERDLPQKNSSYWLDQCDRKRTTRR